MNSDSVEEILRRAFLIGCEVGSLDHNYEISGVKYIPTGEVAALDRHYAQKHAAEVIELIGQIKGNRDYSWKTIEADLRKAVEEHFDG